MAIFSLLFFSLLSFLFSLLSSLFSLQTRESANLVAVQLLASIRDGLGANKPCCQSIWGSLAAFFVISSLFSLLSSLFSLLSSLFSLLSSLFSLLLVVVVSRHLDPKSYPYEYANPGKCKPCCSCSCSLFNRFECVSCGSCGSWFRYCPPEGGSGIVPPKKLVWLLLLLLLLFLLPLTCLLFFEFVFFIFQHNASDSTTGHRGRSPY